MTASIYGIAGLATSFPDLAVSSYQRSVVWKGRQKGALVRSLLKDYPTGIIVLNKVPPPAGVSPTLAAVVPALAQTHDIIDGQQRLTCLFEFLGDPLRYILEWQKKPVPDPADQEPFVIENLRLRFDDLTKALRPPRSPFVPVGTSKPDLIKRIRETALSEYQRKKAGLQSTNPDFDPLVACIEAFATEVGQRHVVIQELTNIGTIDAERMYHLINTSGTELRWWELLRVDHDFTQRSYGSAVQPAPRNAAIVHAVSGRYTAGARLRRAPIVNDSFWHALFAVGEILQYRLAVTDPRVNSALLGEEKRRLQVQGLGFRLVSAYLSHNVSRVAISSLFESYSEEEVGKAVDTLIDTATILFDAGGRHSRDFALFRKYALFRQSVVPAYPLLGVFIAAAKLVGYNEAQGNGVTLTRTDTLSLRALAEEIFREALCTPKWAGSGDSKLRSWLDSHFSPAHEEVNGSRLPYPGRIRNVSSTYAQAEWDNLLASLQPTGQPGVDKNTSFLAFWIQYLFDSKVPGALPTGDVEFDHIVPFQNSPASKSTHPLNIAAVTGRLNSSKKKQTYGAWAPTGADAAAYKLQTLDSIILNVAGAHCPSQNYLPNATHARIAPVLQHRKELYEFGLQKILPDWISNGD